jgi:hypothetical protein
MPLNSLEVLLTVTEYFLGAIICRFSKKPKPGPLRRGNRVSVLDLYQIKGGRLCLYLLLDLDY